MKEELYNELPEVLKNLKNTPDPRRVPEGYFDQLEDRIFERLDAQGERDVLSPPTVRPKLRMVWFNPRVLSAVAASVALVLAAWWFWKPVENQIDTIAAVNTESFEFTPEMAESYIEAHLMDFDPEVIAMVEPEETDLSGVQDGAQNPPVEKKVRSKKSKSAEELDELLDQLTDEELEELL